MPGRSFVGANGYRYGFDGQEKDDEFFGNGNSYDFGARIYDSRIGRWLSIDPLVGKYPDRTPYDFARNNPIAAIDIGGKDVYLLVWFSKEKGEDGLPETGHAAIAVDNYKKVETKVLENGKTVNKISYVKDGTFTYYDLWPETPVGPTELDDNVIDDYNKKTVSDLKSAIISSSRESGKVSEFGEGRAADGIVKIGTGDKPEESMKIDDKVKKALDGPINSSKDYNASSNNCSNYAQTGVKVIDPSIDASQIVKPEGVLAQIYETAKVVAPNNLYNAAAKMPNATILKGPKQVEAKPYLKYFGK